ncbi:3-alpha,7-alpha,12-alpha-trihydroxy-5-beta-cholest-24-enoyl-CoA hydratase [Actinoplanes ianthinogenes]|uniref:3-alpha,7-alpha,12-alpha-trihydroxy-5-beta-choles t-24-enoyl-CoA hydratase n=1 Tax=Actinoplanes ianthinogenes TaxID=122358 RepID=A0ABM7LPT3_9ACTN|nr:MaoC/PaaZ C-terminal domain-containing protein [Actinoplanes ianthinogenes]BCJ41242.1 3-alpha,7-alpha,12-alpha-trihydroxy-5-beta-choles t-24-enoyl-CoA hydratase [Actinoplanes ianthinogenes]GGR21965.1 3-alpha,7-alpha,12-alpha-trihydroxy-5-beta-cholest-24-enoyl-CoA hydratase [Actinoplanes ianthinogenes]
MPIDPDTAVGAELPSRDLSWDSTDVLLYHLAIGADELSYVYEDALCGVLPTFATVATTLRDTAPPSVTMPGVDVDLTRVVHGRQELEIHRPIPVKGRCVARSRIVAVHDKGSAAVVVTETVTELFTSRISIFVKGAGGFGGDRGPDTRVPMPDREPDAEVLTPTDPRQALWYRLLGDRNPLHVDPAFAARAGFGRPILHGLCTYGMVLKAAVGGEPDRVAGYQARFAGVVHPGETLRTRIWYEDDRLLLTATVADRNDAPALSDAVVTLR